MHYNVFYDRFDVEIKYSQHTGTHITVMWKAVTINKCHQCAISCSHITWCGETVSINNLLQMCYVGRQWVIIVRYSRDFSCDFSCKDLKRHVLSCAKAINSCSPFVWCSHFVKHDFKTKTIRTLLCAVCSSLGTASAALSRFFYS